MRSLALALMLLLSVPSLARANPERLLYAHQTSCPDRTAFVAALSERGANLATLDEQTTLSVAVSQVGGEFVGSLSVSGGSALDSDKSGRTDDGGARTMNEGAGAPAIEPKFVRGASCEEVVDALAAMTALAISSRPKSTEAPASQLTAESQPTVKPTPKKRVRDEARPEAILPTPPPTVFRHRQRPMWGEKRPEHRARFDAPAGTTYVTDLLSLTLSGGAAYGLIPNTLVPQLDLEFAKASFVTVPSARQTLVSLTTFRIGWFGPVDFARRPTVGMELMGLEFAGGACSSPTFASDGWVVRVCGELGGGVAYTKPYIPDDGTYLGARYWPFALVSTSVTTEYHMTSLMHVALTLGHETRYIDYKTEVISGTKLGMFSGFARAGVGINW